MSTIKNKDIVYGVMRRDITGLGETIHEALCCLTKTHDYAQELANQYTQEFIDRGISERHFDFYVVGNVFYGQ